MAKDTLILLSGGLDSAVLAQFERSRVAMALFFEYGQPALRQERNAAWGVAQFTEIPIRYVTIEMPGMDAMAADSGPGTRVVPARNLLFLSYGVSLALSAGLSRVVFGATADDDAKYLDCRPAFVGAIDQLARQFGIEIAAPFARHTKREIVDIGWRCRARLDLAWSCYTPTLGGGPCGVCDSCVQRAAAMS